MSMEFEDCSCTRHKFTTSATSSSASLTVGLGAEYGYVHVKRQQELSSRVAEMGDRGHNRHGPKRGGMLCPFRSI